MDFTKYIVENAFVLIPVLYILGNILKSLQFIPDKYIPLGLLVLGILLACALLGFNINSVIQGVLLVGVTVYSNQVVKQLFKDNSFVAPQTGQGINQANEVKQEASTTTVNSTVSDNSQGTIVQLYNQDSNNTSEVNIKDDSINASVQANTASSKLEVYNPEKIEDGKNVEIVSATSPTV